VSHVCYVALLPNSPLWDQGAGCAGADVAGMHASLACPLVRLRLLRAAWRPCSRGPDRRAAVVAVCGGSAHGGCISSVFDSAGLAEIPYSTITSSLSAADGIRL